MQDIVHQVIVELLVQSLVKCFCLSLDFQRKQAENRSMEKKTRRHFSGKRLYTLLKWIVLGSTVLAVVLAGISFYQAYSLYTSSGLSTDYSVCDSLYPNHSILTDNSDYSNWSSCEKTVGTINSTEEDGIFFVGIAILLPFLFFGGGWLYSYLFPVNEKDPESTEVKTKDVLYEQALAIVLEYEYALC